MGYQQVRPNASWDEDAFECGGHNLYDRFSITAVRAS